MGKIIIPFYLQTDDGIKQDLWMKFIHFVLVPFVSMTIKSHYNSLHHLFCTQTKQPK